MSGLTRGVERASHFLASRAGGLLALGGGAVLGTWLTLRLLLPSEAAGGVQLSLRYHQPPDSESVWVQVALENREARAVSLRFPSSGCYVVLDVREKGGPAGVRRSVPLCQRGGESVVRLESGAMLIGQRDWESVLPGRSPAEVAVRAELEVQVGEAGYRLAARPEGEAGTPLPRGLSSGLFPAAEAREP